MVSWKNSEVIILITTISLGALVSIFDFVGIFENIKWIQDKIPNITLFIVALIATSLIVKYHHLRWWLDMLSPERCDVGLG